MGQITSGALNGGTEGMYVKICTKRGMHLRTAFTSFELGPEEPPAALWVLFCLVDMKSRRGVGWGAR